MQGWHRQTAVTRDRSRPRLTAQRGSTSMIEVFRPHNLHTIVIPLYQWNNPPGWRESMSRRHGALHLASAQYPTTREGKARCQGGLHPGKTQCTQVSCGTLPASVRLLHLNHERIRLVLLGWFGRASLVAWVPEVLCAALDLADAKAPQRAKYADRATGSGRHCPVPFPYAKLFHALSRFSWQHGMDARGAEGWRLPHARHPCVDLRIFGQNAPSQ